ncbi:hypothetical protein FF1_032065 [Malus domestica]
MLPASALLPSLLWSDLMLLEHFFLFWSNLYPHPLARIMYFPFEIARDHHLLQFPLSNHAPQKRQARRGLMHLGNLQQQLSYGSVAPPRLLEKLPSSHGSFLAFQSQHFGYYFRGFSPLSSGEGNHFVCLISF